MTGNTIQTTTVSVNVGLTTETLTISNNTIVTGVGCAPPDCEGEGIGIYQAPATVSNNTIYALPSSQALGIDVEESQNVRVSGNKLNGVWSGISLINSATSVVTGNTVNSSGWVALRVYEASPGGNAVINNTVDEAFCGLSQVAAKGDTLGPNTYHNTISKTC